MSSSLPTSPARSTGGGGDMRAAPFIVSPLDSVRQADIAGGGSFSSSSVSPLHSRSVSQPAVVHFTSHVSSSLDSTEPSSESSGGGGAQKAAAAVDSEWTTRRQAADVALPPVLPSRAVSPPPRPLKSSAAGGSSSGPSLVKATSHNSHIFKQFSQVGWLSEPCLR